MLPIKFLIVEDDSPQVELLKQILHNSYKDAEIRSSIDNEGAYAILQEWSPNLIITDIYHPGNNGYDLLSKLRNDPETWSIPILVMSGAHSSDEAQLKLYRHGFNAVLSKPYLIQKLIMTINQLLHLHASPDSALIYAGYESPDRDYKTSVDLISKVGKASIAKDVIAMSNYGGGIIIVGVAEDRHGHFTPAGVSDALITLCETTRLNKAIRTFMDPHIHVTSRYVQERGLNYLFIEVPAAKEEPIMVTRKNEEAGLYPGRIYTRTTAAESAEVQTSQELRNILKRFIKRENK